jgi:hypothetical protein
MDLLFYPVQNFARNSTDADFAQDGLAQVSNAWANSTRDYNSVHLYGSSSDDGFSFSNFEFEVFSPTTLHLQGNGESVIGNIVYNDVHQDVLFQNGYYRVETGGGVGGSYDLAVSVVPEPSIVLAFAMILVGCLFMRARKVVTG